MNSLAFRAECVVWEDPDGYAHLVGFTDHATETKDYLLLQRAFDIEEGDEAYGMGTYHVEICSQERSAYDGIRSFKLFRDAAEVSFEEHPQSEVIWPASVRITFELDEPSFSSLQAALSRIFEGSGCFVAAGA